MIKVSFRMFEIDPIIALFAGKNNKTVMPPERPGNTVLYRALLFGSRDAILP